MYIIKQALVMDLPPCSLYELDLVEIILFLTVLGAVPENHSKHQPQSQSEHDVTLYSFCFRK